MTEKKRFVSLHVRLLAVMLLGIAASLGMFFLARAVGDWMVEYYYLSDEAVERRNRDTIEELQYYINVNNISSRSTDAIARWTIAKGDVYILLYKDQRLALEAGWWGIDSEMLGAEDLAALKNVKIYPLSFRDGLFQAVVYDFSETNMYDLSNLCAVFLACALFALILLLYNRGITRAIVTVSQEVQQIGDGELSLHLQSKGRNELTLLMDSVEAMRLSLVKKTEEEREALEKNSELISAMSHDIRNPLTALLGYLDLLRREQYRSKEEAASYVQAAYDKAEQLKALTNELLRYSLLFGSKELPLDLQAYDARILLSQLLGEQSVSLQQAGFTVQVLPLELSCRIHVDVLYFKRVLDNLFDNVRKHADPAGCVTVGVFDEDGELHICIGNTVSQRKQPVESNKIGLKTCEKILGQMNGRLVRHIDAGKFSAEVILPRTDAEEPANS